MIPSITFNCEGVSSLSKEAAFYSSKDLFAGKRCVVFHERLFAPSLTPYLPFYEKMYDAMKAAGIDEVYCASANDGHVMRQWFLSQGCVETSAADSLGFKQVKPLPGGNLLFHSTSACSWSNLNVSAIQSYERAAAVINDIKVEKLFKEINSSADPEHMPVAFKEANAGRVLTYLRESFSFTNLLIPPMKSSEEYIQQFDEFGEYEVSDTAPTSPGLHSQTFL